MAKAENRKRKAVAKIIERVCAQILAKFIHFETEMRQKI